LRPIIINIATNWTHFASKTKLPFEVGREKCKSSFEAIYASRIWQEDDDFIKLIEHCFRRTKGEQESGSELTVTVLIITLHFSHCAILPRDVIESLHVFVVSWRENCG